MSVKTVFFLIFTVGLVHVGSAPLQPIQAVVVRTNLSPYEANAIAEDIVEVYRRVSGCLNRANEIQLKLEYRYPYLYNSALINFTAASYYQKYYVVIYINGDYVLAFGLFL